MRWELISRNIADLADPPRPAKPEMRVWSSEQMKTFLTATEGERLGPVYVVMCTCGLRRGEALGLRWQDVDLDGGRLSVRQTLVSTGYKIEFGRPKTTKSTRRISLDGHTVAVLRAWRKVQLEERLAWGSAYQDADLVFPREDGSPLHPQSLTKAFGRDAKAAGLPVIRLHDLRHSHATAALAAGVNVKVISERLGHSSVGITMNCYQHVIPAMEEAAASKIASLIFGAS